MKEEKQKLMVVRGRSKVEAANTKVEIMARFEKLRKKGISKNDLKELGFDNLSKNESSNKIPTPVESTFSFEQKKRSNTIIVKQ